MRAIFQINGNIKIVDSIFVEQDGQKVVCKYHGVSYKTPVVKEIVVEYDFDVEEVSERLLHASKRDYIDFTEGKIVKYEEDD